MADVTAKLAEALRRAFALGQTYWQQADSESYTQNAKSEVTHQKFRDLMAETLAAYEQAQAEPVALNSIKFYSNRAATPAPAPQPVQDLPPLPEPGAIEYNKNDADGYTKTAYTADQMRDYARAALAEVDEQNAQLREQNIAVDEACARYEAENKQLRAALAATPAPAPQPLTDEQKGNEWRLLLPLSERFTSADWFEAGACFAEQHHGIGQGAATPAPEPTKAQEALKLIATASPGEHAFEYMRGIARAALAATPAPAEPPRCPLCEYQHGHAIGCANNPVDIALKAMAPAPAPQAETECDDGLRVAILQRDLALDARDRSAAELAAVPLDAIREVIRISDRSHPAWDEVKAWLAGQGKEASNG